MKRHDLRVVDPAYRPTVGPDYLRVPTVADLVAALIAEGGEIVESWNAPIGTAADYYEVLDVFKPGRYLVFPIPAEKETTR